MIRLIILLAAVALLTSCSEGRPPMKADSVKSSHSAMTEVQSQEKATTASPGVTSLQKAYVDPDTGELISRPVQKELDEGDAAQPSTLGGPNEESLEIEPSPVEGGGIMVDLKGRFQNPIKANVDGKGDARIDHSNGEKTE